MPGSPSLARTSRRGRADRGIAFFNEFAINIGFQRYTAAVTIGARRKTSFEIDFAKVESVKEILGTRTLTETVDVALDEVLKVQQRRRLVELLFTPGSLDLDDPEVMAGAWR
jgi:hypothetical protein